MLDSYGPHHRQREKPVTANEKAAIVYDHLITALFQITLANTPRDQRLTDLLDSWLADYEADERYGQNHEEDHLQAAIFKLLKDYIKTKRR